MVALTGYDRCRADKGVGEPVELRVIRRPGVLRVVVVEAGIDIIVDAVDRNRVAGVSHGAVLAVDEEAEYIIERRVDVLVVLVGTEHVRKADLVGVRHEVELENSCVVRRTGTHDRVEVCISISAEVGRHG